MRVSSLQGAKNVDPFRTGLRKSRILLDFKRCDGRVRSNSDQFLGTFRQRRQVDDSSSKHPAARGRITARAIL